MFFLDGKILRPVLYIKQAKVIPMMHLNYMPRGCLFVPRVKGKAEATPNQFALNVMEIIYLRLQQKNVIRAGAAILLEAPQVGEQLIIVRHVGRRIYQ